MRFRFASLITFLMIAGCSGTRTSLPPAPMPQSVDRHEVSVASTGLRPYGRDLMLLKLDFSIGFSIVAYSPYAVTGSKPDFDIFTAESIVSGLARDPTTNSFCFGGAQETIICDAPSPPGGGGVGMTPSDIGQVGIDHRGTIYGTFPNGASPPGTMILGWVKGNGGLPNIFLTGPRTGIDGDGGIAFDERNELFAFGNGTLSVFAPGATGDVAPIRTLKGVTGNTSVDERGDVATVVGSKVELFKALSSGNTPPVKTLSGVSGYIVGVIYCDTDTLWLLVVTTTHNWQINLYAAGWNGNTRPTRVIKLPSPGPSGQYSNFTLY